MAAVIGALRAELSATIARFEEDMGKAAGAVGRFSKSFGKMGKQMQRVGGTLSTRVTAPIAAFGALSLKAAGDFEQGMNRVAAVSGASAEQLVRLREQAKEMGAETQFSASQAADAMGFLAQAGFDAEQVLASLPGTLQLAAAAQMDLGEAADIVSNVLSGYRLEVSELGRVNDVLVKGFTSTNTNLQQLGDAMKFVGPVAAAAGADFEEVTAALGLMGNAGIQGEMAGTALRGAISKILNPTKQVRDAMAEAGVSFTDSAGKLLPLLDIVRQLEPHAEDAGLFMKLFGQRAGPAMAALVGQGAGALEGLTAELENSGGTAERIAGVQMEGFNGQMRALASAFEALQIAIAESGLIEWAAEFVKVVAEWFREISKSNPEMLKWGTIIAGIVAVVGPVIAILGSMVAGIAALAPVVAAAGAALGTLVAFLGGPLTLAIGAVVAAWVFWDEIVEIVEQVYTAVKTWMMDKLGAVFDWVGEKVAAVTGFFEDMYEAVVGGSFVPDMIDGIAAEFGRLEDVMVKPAEAAADQVSGAFEKTADGVAGIFEQALRDGTTSMDELKSLALDTARHLAETLFINPFVSEAKSGLSALISGGTGAGGGAAGAGGGGFFAGLGSFFAGFFAEGGVIPRGQFGIVGENGPEPVFAAGGDLNVLPAGSLGGGVTQVFNIRTPDANSFRLSERQIARAAKQRLSVA